MGEIDTGIWCEYIGFLMLVWLQMSYDKRIKKTSKLADSLNINFWLQIIIKPINLHSLWKSNLTPLTHRTDHVGEVIKEAKQRCLGERISFPKLFNGVKKPYILSPSTQMYLDKRKVNRPYIEHLGLNNIWTQRF